MDKLQKIRNFCIIAHIDHGKSTLADRIIQKTNTVAQREFRDQYLDNMDLERERGITIKSSAVKISYKAQDGEFYHCNLIDTPGHVDFTYEVSKSIAACEGALLVVDAVQGVEAQTIANLYLAVEHDLKIIPVINKIDLKNARTEEVRRQIREVLGLEEEPLLVSAKEDIGTSELLEEVVRSVPPPNGSESAPLQGLIFDSSYDTYRGVVVYLRIMNGSIRPGDAAKMMNQGSRHEVKEVGIFSPGQRPVDSLDCGQVGYIICNIKDAKEVVVGDTVTDLKKPAGAPLPGYRPIKPMVFSGIYPVGGEDYEDLKTAMEKLRLSDSSFVYEPETSAAIGFGFRCGFLGLLHMEIIQERLEREFDLDLITTSPSVTYRISLSGEKDEIDVDNPSKFPDRSEIVYVKEPYVRCWIFTPVESIGEIMKLCEDKRGEFVSTKYLDTKRAQLTYNLPLAEIIIDFYDKIKSSTKGYGSIDYEYTGYRKSDIVKLDVLINGEPCDALSCLVHSMKADGKGRELVRELKDVIPRHLFKIALQASVGGKVIARENVRALKKHVTGKCYGGDITRKRKLWEKQKEGKKKMRRIGKVDVPKEAFLKVMRIS